MSSSTIASSTDSLGPSYTVRLESGIYDSIAQQMIAMGTASLAACDYQKDFVRKVEQWSGNFVYRDHTNGEFRTNVVGEIAPASCGTIISAKGNHYAGKPGDFRPVTDDSKCKDVLALRVPTLASGLLKVIFYNQIGALNAIREADEKEEAEACQNPMVREWVRAPGTDATATNDIMLLHMMPKYGKPGGKGGVGKRVYKRTLEEMEGEKSDDTISEIPEVKLGALYDPALSPDFGGAFFDLTYNKLVQLDVRDENNDLIPAWKFYEALRPGTLVLVNVSLHCFVMKERGTHRKIYQANVHSTRVLARSDTAVTIPVRPSVPSTSSSRASPTPSADSASASSQASNAFTNFVITPPISPACSPASSPSVIPPATSPQLRGVTARSVPDVTAHSVANAMPTYAPEDAAVQHVDKKQRKSKRKDAAGEQTADGGLMDMSV